MAMPDKLISVINGPIFWLPVTIAIYAASVGLYRRFNKAPLLNPTLFTIGGISAVLIISAVPTKSILKRLQCCTTCSEQPSSHWLFRFTII
jgi:putative effector of murein hydrolase